MRPLWTFRPPVELGTSPSKTWDKLFGHNVNRIFFITPPTVPGAQKKT